jgi:glycosyltransferase involved in cell wall biosynthesis
LVSKTSNPKKILFISYDGMTDPLGQSQVLPYLVGLSNLGHDFTILSAEKKDRFARNKRKIEEITLKNHITWCPVPFRKTIPFVSKIQDLRQMIKMAYVLHKEKTFDLIHCRSYVSTFIGYRFKKKFNVPYLFDIRGFWIDERVDSGNWNINNPLIRVIFSFLKSLEKKFYENAAHVISLSEAGKREIGKWDLNIVPEVTVIPCSADYSLFQIADISQKTKSRQQLGFQPNDIVISYLGSIGAWYLLDEMLLFFKRFKSTFPNAKFLFISNEQRENITRVAEKYNVNLEDLIITSAKREEVPVFLSASDLSLYFIKPCYSKIASSPTKLGEIMAMGLPVITNSGIGDVKEILADKESGIIISDFTETDYDQAIEQVPKLLQTNPQMIRESIRDYYDLDNAIIKYQLVYSNI